MHVTKPPIVVSFFTPNGPYTDLATTLAKSCEQFGLEYDIERMPDRGSWVDNCAQKPIFCQRMLAKHDRPIIWIDVDGQIVKYPDRLVGNQSDFAIRAEPGASSKRPAGRGLITLPHGWPQYLKPRWFNTGTIYFNNSPQGVQLVEHWTFLQSEDKNRSWDQWTLQQAWCDCGATIDWLPQGYCKTSRRAWCADEIPVNFIVHECSLQGHKVDKA